MPQPGRSGVGAAFFDVDETLITVKSMFRFLEHHFRERGLPPDAYRRAAATLRERAAAGVSRLRTNREYYRLYAGHPVDATFAHGRSWFEAELATGTLLHEPVVSALRRHRREGALIVLVSGSFRPCLEPVAELLGADEILCGEPEIADGHWTGELERPVIGVEKGRLAREALRRHGVPMARATAYADHASDLHLLRAVGHPVVVGDDTVLGAHVAATGGGTLPGIRCAPRAAALGTG
ncbi:HAD-IB family hydrolase [Streptomyces sp. 3MP-14]|uniref:HAD-IB family hydrolase n=1 Tax=Streptomyces mimosae TaxID=2586635 RepID=A0A5N6A2T2_9ACTN|nr:MULTISPECIES: HAD-IB family hydrolase [Streptomyces]KAB8162279.1 HAD-IB family hydrolase [Streptomyces mimosae]KAB8173822.1 HAD-IB family hydrolase [Streptomyces sp. 3MP-14]